MRDWIFIESCISFFMMIFMMKYSTFNGNIGSGNFNDTFCMKGVGGSPLDSPLNIPNENDVHCASMIDLTAIPCCRKLLGCV